MLLRIITTLTLLIMAACSNDIHMLTDQQKYYRAKQCVDAGMWPDISPTEVICHPAGKLSEKDGP